MDLVATVRKEGSRGGRDSFKWEDVKESAHRENYLGHSLMAPVGRWAKGRDLQWYAKAKDDTAAEDEARQREEELKRIKEAEQEAMARALGLPVPAWSREPNRRKKKRESGSVASAPGTTAITTIVLTDTVPNAETVAELAAGTEAEIAAETATEIGAEIEGGIIIRRIANGEEDGEVIQNPTTTSIIRAADTAITNIADIAMAIGRDRDLGLDHHLHLNEGTVGMTEIEAVSDEDTRVVI
ncbi:hypothetical protein VTN49DRAFT_2517 [Thermomyces lanuginosus]|uniref:uncharacterized protein n=1 Tax=Thermomyces lanuginosus TaxID=5541 RepID=UPI003743D9DC